MTRKPDKYGREVRIVTISGRQYRILPEVRKPTIYIKDIEGKFRGRASGVSRSDQTQYVRILQNIDFNKDKFPELRSGQIVGRITRYPNMRPKQGSPIKVRVHVSNKESIAAMKKAQKEKFREIKSQKRRK